MGRGGAPGGRRASTAGGSCRNPVPGRSARRRGSPAAAGRRRGTRRSFSGKPALRRHGQSIGQECRDFRQVISSVSPVLSTAPSEERTPERHQRKVTCEGVIFTNTRQNAPRAARPCALRSGTACRGRTRTRGLPRESAGGSEDRGRSGAMSQFETELREKGSGCERARRLVESAPFGTRALARRASGPRQQGRRRQPRRRRLPAAGDPPPPPPPPQQQLQRGPPRPSVRKRASCCRIRPPPRPRRP